MNLEGRVVRVTGSGTGNGRAIAERFARDGVKVAVNYHKSRQAGELRRRASERDAPFPRNEVFLSL
jgi:NAD(P)-dependent dehydrogenase (short-subunit alcohol dehydrogenase family)